MLVAKLSMGALAQGGVWYGGSTRNPWSPENSSSGSSAGPGSATASGLVGFSVGTETRGSIISPSSTCGVVGLRPTYDEATVLRVALAYERATTWHTMHPALDDNLKKVKTDAPLDRQVGRDRLDGQHGIAYDL